MKASEIIDKPIKSIKFKNGAIYICIKGNGVMENNPNKLPYLNHIKDSIKNIVYF